MSPNPPSFRNIHVGLGLAAYARQLRAFQPNARLYLISLVITGAAFGVYRLLFNFYALSLGFDQSLLGLLVTVTSLASLAGALPMGYLADTIGHRRALLAGTVLEILSVAWQVFFPGAASFIASSAVFGLGQALTAVTMGPFLMDNSGDQERTYLFSYASGLQTAAGFAGSWIGGFLPTWIGTLTGSTATSSSAYAGSLGLIALFTAGALVPLLSMRSRTQPVEPGEKQVFAPLAYFRGNSALLGRLVLPMLITSIGAGLIMPFMNVFYRQVFGQPDPVIGALFAWGSLAMGLGLMAAPPLAGRLGKIQLVVVTQSLSIPFLAMMGYSPWFALSAGAYLIRVALMNMSGPIYQTFVMERVEARARGTVASLVSMAGSFGWAFSPSLSGWLQVRYGFAPVYACTLLLYCLSIYLYWRYFWPRTEARSTQTSTIEMIEEG